MRFALLYCDCNGEQHVAIVNDTTHANLPIGADDVLRKHGNDFNDGAPVFVLPLNDTDEPEITDASGAEVAREFIDL